MALMVCEIFGSFQGEGARTGRPTTFVRFSGCNLDCSWCDTPYSKDPEEAREMVLDEVIERISSIGLDLICLTGGEPLLHDDIIPLVERLTDLGFIVDLETNGSLSISGLADMERDIRFSIDYKLPSSGSHGSFLMGNLDLIGPEDQIKFIIKDDKDIERAMEFILQTRPDCDLIFTPVDNSGGELIADSLMGKLNDPEIGEYLRKHVRLMVQTHKVIWGADSRGV